MNFTETIQSVFKKIETQIVENNVKAIYTNGNIVACFQDALGFKPELEDFEDARFLILTGSIGECKVYVNPYLPPFENKIYSFNASDGIDANDLTDATVLYACSEEENEILC